MVAQTFLGNRRIHLHLPADHLFDVLHSHQICKLQDIFDIQKLSFIRRLRRLPLLLFWCIRIKDLPIFLHLLYMGVFPGYRHLSAVPFSRHFHADIQILHAFVQMTGTEMAR